MITEFSYWYSINRKDILSIQFVTQNSLLKQTFYHCQLCNQTTIELTGMHLICTSKCFQEYFPLYVCSTAILCYLFGNRPSWQEYFAHTTPKRLAFAIHLWSFVVDCRTALLVPKDTLLAINGVISQSLHLLVGCFSSSCEIAETISIDLLPLHSHLLFLYSIYPGCKIICYSHFYG